MKKNFIYFLSLVLLMTLAGCETVQRKFTPKKKTPERPVSAIYLEEGPYRKKYSNEYYYKTHYTLWQTWHDELLDNLGGNEKKTNRAAQESIGHLQQMQQYLNPRKNGELEIVIDDMAEVIKKLGQGGRASQVGPLRTELSRIRRAVGNDFYYNKIKDNLLPDKVDLGDQK